MDTLTVVVLCLSGLLQLLVGAFRLIRPAKTFAEKSGITLGDDVSLLSEARGVGGVAMLLGAAFRELRLAALVVAMVIFGGFAQGGALGMRLDGRPNKLLVQGLAFELVFASLAAFGVYTYLM